MLLTSKAMDPSSFTGGVPRPDSSLTEDSDLLWPFLAFVFSVDDLVLAVGTVVVEPFPSEESRDRADEPSLTIGGSG